MSGREAGGGQRSKERERTRGSERKMMIRGEKDKKEMREWMSEKRYRGKERMEEYKKEKRVREERIGEE